ncbi:hypothetical protein F5Y18DRAFT_383065 [Xylariaceae sp. FL1019]|nr:hypothetical protein F5Y18DRAFT_383065 [Xylariaceae sp. FL1019]
MHRAWTSRWLNSALLLTERPSKLELPVFLCPSVSVRTSIPPSRRSRAVATSPPTSRRCLHMQADASTTVAPVAPAVDLKPVPPTPTRNLPQQCTGCGALSQTSHSNQPGYYDLSRKAVRKYMGVDTVSHQSKDEDDLLTDALKNLDPDDLGKQGVDLKELKALALAMPSIDTKPQALLKKPMCDRCHYLIHNNSAESIYHPSVDSIRDTLLESPYKYNHVYHVLDAADFPMSLVPRIGEFLDAMPLRSRNRRSRTGRFYHGQKTEVSFIITRADLLAPTKAQVDNLFPYLREVLRDALGRSGRDVRLGNLRAVSAKRDWWTKELKEDIWKRGGAGWMLGKANVGKSQLFEKVFPKGRMDWKPSQHQITIDMKASTRHGLSLGPDAKAAFANQESIDNQVIDEDLHDEFSLLPPAPEETQFPEMPVVSDLPGTTASPIRVPFGNGRGELIDLPGLERTGLEEHVKKEHRPSLLMRSRLSPEQMTVKPGQSLLLGGMIRITPRESSPIMLTYNFTPIEPHVSRTDKAMGIQAQSGEVSVENIAEPGTGPNTKLAGSFELKWDVTKQRTGPLMRKSAVNLDIERLPYRVVSTDILVEGVGWVEIVAQVRTKDLYAPRLQTEGAQIITDPELDEKLSAMERLEAVATDKKGRKVIPDLVEPVQHKPSTEPNWPIVDVYSPGGKFISARKPMNGWMMNKPRVTAASKKSRPKKSMKGQKKLEKMRARQARQVAAKTAA